MIARGGAMAAMGYLPVEFAAEDKTDDTEILASANHDCQHTYISYFTAPRYAAANRKLISRLLGPWQ